jgi:2-oxoglutarate dehydrogenase E2 component (dihydrolipoamide succinyltransferase)
MTLKITVPELGESVFEATVEEWLKSEGDSVKAGEALVMLETDKVNFEVTAEKAGTLAKINHAAGEDVRVGDVLGIIEEESGEAEVAPSEEANEAAEAEEPEPVAEAQASKPQEKSGERITPVARRLAEERGIDLSGIKSGERITKDDVERLIAERENGKQKQQEQPKRSEPAALDESREERIRMSRRRRTIAQRLVEAQQTTAMLTTFNEIDMSAVMELRARRKESFKEKHDIGLGITSFFVRAVTAALRDFPRVNAEIDGDEIILKYHYDIGVAIGAEEGLVVPVLRDADRMSFAEIERAIKDFAQQATDRSLALEDLRGGTFSITNGGVFGSMLSTPILNPPQVGILGLHMIEKRPVAVDEEVVIRPMMYVALSYDHRVIDGREAVQFLVRIKELIEDPERLLLEG